MKEIRLTVNGTPAAGRVEPRMTLADFLRERLNLTGTHLGCEHGVCGACTILVSEDGQPPTAMRACLMLAVQADGQAVTTVEGMSRDGSLTPLQRAFQRHHALHPLGITIRDLPLSPANIKRLIRERAPKEPT